METLLYTANFVNLKSYDLSNKFNSCILTISVGQNVHEGEKIKATLNLINKNFKKCTIRCLRYITKTFHSNVSWFRRGCIT